ncbi:MAG TPA: paraquat-inducible protein A [Planctomycetes bacterium]|nr:paraquat-inducible protein A [Planctomycetota bacterium]
MPPFLYETCAFCGLHQAIPAHGPDFAAECARCGHRLADPFRRPSGPAPSLAAALAALLMYPFAILLPVFTLERMGQGTSASVWSGAVGLLAGGEWFVGGVVFLCSILLPLAKLLVLAGLPLFGERLSPAGRRRALRLVETAGRWGMLDVLLVALLVAWLEFGDLMRVTPGPGTLAFTLCVLTGLVASALLDPRSLFPPEASDVP